MPAHHILGPQPLACSSSSPLLGYEDDFADQLTEVEQTIRYSDTSANGLQRLDSVVNEFTSQFPVDSPSDGANIPSSPASVV